MHAVLIALAAVSLMAMTATSVVGQTPSDAAKKETPPAGTTKAPNSSPAAEAKKATPPATEKTGQRAERAKLRARMSNRRVSRAGHRRTRTARHRHPRWRYVWVYRADDSRGYRRYDYVPRRFGGYFATGRGCACRHAVHAYRHAHRWHH